MRNRLSSFPSTQSICKMPAECGIKVMEVEMKKFFVLFAIVSLAAGSLFAANLNVSATVQQVLEVSLGATTSLTFTDLTGTGDKTTSGATLNLKSNRPAWTITFASQNSGADKGKLKATSTSAASIPYGLKVVLSGSWGNYTNVTNSLSADFVSLATDKTIVGVANSKTPVDGVNFDLSAELTMPSGTDEMFEAGTTFTDTVVISILAN